MRYVLTVLITVGIIAGIAASPLMRVTVEYRRGSEWGITVREMQLMIAVK